MSVLEILYMIKVKDNIYFTSIKLKFRIEIHEAIKREMSPVPPPPPCQITNTMRKVCNPM